MTGTTKLGASGSDNVTGDVCSLFGASGREFAHPGTRVDSSGTPGAATQHATMGRVAIAAGQSSVVVTNRYVNVASAVLAVISQAAADGTLTQILRVSPANGSFTITGNANATAATQIDYVVRISVIVDAHFSLIVDGQTASRRTRRGGAQALRLNVAQSSTISLKRRPVACVIGLVLGLI